MSPLFLYTQPLPFEQGMALIALMVVGTIVLVPVGGYIMVRLLAYAFNSRQGSWESSAKPLGLTVDKKAGGLYKPLVGERNGVPISVTFFGLPTNGGDGLQVDPCALVEVTFRTPLDFSLKLYRRETLLDRVIAKMADDSDELGHEFFDEVFKIDCSDVSSLRSLFNVEMMDAESSTILTDLVLAAKKYPRVIMTDRSLSLGVHADCGRADLIEPVIAKAAYLASRIELAAAR